MVAVGSRRDYMADQCNGSAGMCRSGMGRDRRKAWTSGEVSHCSINRCRSRYLHIMVSVQGLEGSGESCGK